MKSDQSLQKQKYQRFNQVSKKIIFLCLCTASFLLIHSTGFAVEFTGTLDGMSISDAEGTNTPPTAIFSYTLDGENVIFDASRSTDQDGTIIDFIWDFGNNNSSMGITTSYVHSSTEPLTATLTLIDNDGGISISQTTINQESQLSDDFTSDTSGDYASTVGGISVAGGLATGSANYSYNSAIHSTTLASDDNYAQADVELAVSSPSGVIARASASSTSATGYAAIFYNTTLVRLFTFSGSTFTYTGKQWTINPITSGTLYTMKLVASGTTFELWIDTGGGLTKVTGDLTDTTYSTGKYSGLVFNRSAGQAPRADNFLAE